MIPKYYYIYFSLLFLGWAIATILSNIPTWVSKIEQQVTEETANGICWPIYVVFDDKPYFTNPCSK